MGSDQREELKKVVYSERFETSDYTQIFESKLYMQKLTGNDVWIYGIDNDILQFVKLFFNEGLSVKGIISPDSRDDGKKINNIEIFSVERVRQSGG